ncbi:MAG: hypothetical protein GFH24_608434n11 [Chloroflexi bacterium AL-N5]|nr:hypothetical protein [Chloroflexi bacterium AL-N5]
MKQVGWFLLVILLAFVGVIHAEEDDGDGLVLMHPYLRLPWTETADGDLLDISAHMTIRKVGMSARHTEHPMLSLYERFYPTVEQAQLVLEHQDAAELWFWQDIRALIFTVYRNREVLSVQLLPVGVDFLLHTPTVIFSSDLYALSFDEKAARDFIQRTCAIVTGVFINTTPDEVILNNCPHSPL